MPDFARVIIGCEGFAGGGVDASRVEEESAIALCSFLHEEAGEVRTVEEGVDITSIGEAGTKSGSGGATPGRAEACDWDEEVEGTMKGR